MSLFIVSSSSFILKRARFFERSHQMVACGSTPLVRQGQFGCARSLSLLVCRCLSRAQPLHPCVPKARVGRVIDQSGYAGQEECVPAHHSTRSRIMWEHVLTTMQTATRCQSQSPAEVRAHCSLGEAGAHKAPLDTPRGKKGGPREKLHGGKRE